MRFRHRGPVPAGAGGRCREPPGRALSALFKVSARVSKATEPLRPRRSRPSSLLPRDLLRLLDQRPLCSEGLRESSSHHLEQGPVVQPSVSAPRPSCKSRAGGGDHRGSPALLRPEVSPAEPPCSGEGDPERASGPPCQLCSVFSAKRQPAWATPVISEGALVTHGKKQNHTKMKVGTRN